MERVRGSMSLLGPKSRAHTQITVNVFSCFFFDCLQISTFHICMQIYCCYIIRDSNWKSQIVKKNHVNFLKRICEHVGIISLSCPTLTPYLPLSICHSLFLSLSLSLLISLFFPDFFTLYFFKPSNLKQFEFFIALKT